MYESNYDWLIRKNLDKSSAVYVMPARANGKSLRQLEIYAELFKSDRTVYLPAVLPTVKKACDMINTIRDIEEAVIDFDPYAGAYWMIDVPKTHEYCRYTNGDYWMIDVPKTLYNPFIRPETYIYDSKPFLQSWVLKRE